MASDVHPLTSPPPWFYIDTSVPSMASSSVPTVESLQGRVRQLEERNAALVSRSDSLSFIATYALRALGLQALPLQPEGLWLPDKHAECLKGLAASSKEILPVTVSPPGSWVWHKVS